MKLMPMKVLISQPRGKEHLVKAFETAGASLVNTLTEDVKLIIPTVDEELPFLASATPYLESKGIKVMISDPYTISMCRDKAEFYRFCKRHSFLTPATMQDHLIVKPRFGKASKGVIKLDRSYIVQEDLSELPEVSIDYFADWEETPLSIIPRYRKKIVNGESQEAEFITDMDLTEVTRLGTELGLIGHNVIQGFMTQTKFYFTEVNCRFGGGSWLTFERFNSPKWLIEHANEQLCNK